MFFFDTLWKNRVFKAELARSQKQQPIVQMGILAFSESK